MLWSAGAATGAKSPDRDAPASKRHDLSTLEGRVQGADSGVILGRAQLTRLAEAPPPDPLG